MLNLSQLYRILCVFLFTQLLSFNSVFANPWIGSDASFINDYEDYQIGSEWGKKQVETLDEVPPAGQKIALATAKISGGTAFYLGKYSGEHIIITNHHVCSRDFSCLKGMDIEFPLLSVSAEIKKKYGSWADIDLAILSISIPNGSEEVLEGLGMGFSFKHDLKKNHPLMTFGYGVANNYEENLVGNWDSDCRVASDDIRFLSDPDTHSPSDYNVWSFSNGCDVSHGDSGSAVIDGLTGDIVGLIWTGRTPKPDYVKDSDALAEAIDSNDESIIWNELSYAVPSLKIRDKFQSIAKKRKTNSDLKKILKEIISNK